MKTLKRLAKVMLFIISMATFIPELIFYSIRYIFTGKEMGYFLFLYVLDDFQV